MPQPGSESGYGIMFAGKGITCEASTTTQKQEKKNATQEKHDKNKNATNGKPTDEN
jgi:hypothetical protein